MELYPSPFDPQASSEHVPLSSPTARNLTPNSNSRRNLPSLRPTAAYLRASAVPSIDKASDHPLAIISIDHVLCAHLPTHLSGGRTDVISRMYLETLMDYLLHPHTSWCIAFWSAELSRKEAIQVLKSLKLPVGSPETDERDGVVGVWSKEDMTSGWEGGELSVLNLEVIWDELEKEEGVRWSLEDTVVITDYPAYLKSQPNNFILSPTYLYKSATGFCDDQYLLMLITCLEVLTSESNFANYIPTAKWNLEETWSGTSTQIIRVQDVMIHEAVKICARMRLIIKGGGGN